MKLAHLKTHSAVHLAVAAGSRLLDIPSALAQFPKEGIPASLEALFAGGASAQAALDEYVNNLSASASQADCWHAESQVQYAPCVPAPGKIVCVGLNYRQHAAESGMAVPATPVLFSKFNNTLAAHQEPVRLYPNAEQYDYEAELVAVIGHKARFVSAADAPGYVFGYCNGNELSARDLQFRTSQWLLGKSLDQFLPIGPCLVTADELGDPGNLGIHCWVNGELRQNSNTSDMVFNVAQIISYTSQYMTLDPGDIISTGTPQGVILGMQEKRWLKPGDTVEVEIDRLGKLVNPMV